MSYITRARTFLREVYFEMEKVSFPSREEVINTTLVVIVASIIFAIFLYASDQVIVKLYQLFNQTLGA